MPSSKLTIYTVDCKERGRALSQEYTERLAEFLIELACSDDSGYIARGLIFRTASSELPVRENGDDRGVLWKSFSGLRHVDPISLDFWATRLLANSDSSLGVSMAKLLLSSECRGVGRGLAMVSEVDKSKLNKLSGVMSEGG